MRHSKRDFMTTSDVKLAMKKLGVSDVFGYPSHVPFQYQKMQIHNPSLALNEEESTIEQKEQVLWYQKVEQIDLKEYVLNNYNT